MVEIAPQGPDDHVKDDGSGPDFLAGGSDMGGLIRRTTWTDTPLGSPENWPISLKTAVGIMLSSRYAMFVWWGRELVNLYNDAYRPFLGAKHPSALGRSAKDVWAEIWELIGPRTDAVLTRGQSTFDEALLLIMERNGYPEETYFTFSYSPLRNDAGEIGGIFAAVTDETLRIIRERRLATLREVAAASPNTHEPEQVCAAMADAIGGNPWAVPFALIYLLRPDDKIAHLSGHTGIEVGWSGAPMVLKLDGGLSPWPLDQAVESGAPAIVENLSSRLDHVPMGPWDRPPNRAMVIPLKDQATTSVTGFLIMGLNPYRLLDDEYHDFIGLLANQVAAGIGNARAYQEERRRAEALAEIDRAKTAFFSNVSHEFRTPLTLILGSLENLLAQGPDSAPGNIYESGAVAHRNALRLLNLVNTLLDFSRIEAGRVEASYEPIDVATFTAELVSSFQSACDRAGLTLKICCPELNEQVFVDPGMWEKIVLNLVSNAFKFTFEGEIRVAVDRLADGSAVELTVSDTGTGIPEHELPRLFDRFHRIEGAKGRSFEGSGIGLALVHDLVKLHGGSITTKSQLEHGTTFTVSLPLGSGHLPQDRIREARAAPTGAQGQAYVQEALSWLPGDDGGKADYSSIAGSVVKELDPADTVTGRVLLVDDNADMRNYVRRLLLDQGYEVETAGDGEAALELVYSHAPELVLSDVMMPRLDGFGLLQRLRADPQTSDIPVILLSARASEDARLEGIGAGADDYLTKPFSARELLARVSTNLRLARVRREAMEALRARTMELETVLETVPTGVWFTYDADARSVTANRQAANLLRLPPEKIRSLAAPDNERPDVAVFRNGIELARRNLPLARAVRGEEVRNEEIEFRFPDGNPTMLLVQATPLRKANGRIVGAVAAAMDITARKNAEQALHYLNENLEQQVTAEIERRQLMEFELRQAQKMEAVGQLTGGVAHDINNLLLVIQANLERLERQNFAGDTAARAVQMALGGVARTAELTHRLLAFARRQPLAPIVIEPNRLVAGMSELLRRTLGEAVAIKTAIAGGMWRVFADPSQLENAILNLAVNARDAMPKGGRLTIETANTYLDDVYAAKHHEVTPGQYGMIAVSDSGTGMTSEQIERAFEPFFTTKGPDRGTGLGLSQVYGFIKQSGGHVNIYSELGKGTTVRMYLPRYMGSGESDPVEKASVPMPTARPGETILVVEDEENVRATTVESLRDLGYRVLVARDGAEAFPLIESDPSIKLMFTDVGLPGGQNGRQLADAVRQRRPDLKVLFTTGYARDAIVHDGRLDPRVELLVKPYTYAALAGKIRTILDSGYP